MIRPYYRGRNDPRQGGRGGWRQASSSEHWLLSQRPVGSQSGSSQLPIAVASKDPKPASGVRTRKHNQKPRKILVE